MTELGWVREMNEGVKRIYSEMESAFLHEPKFSEPGNKVVLTLENNIVSRHLRTRDSLEKQFSYFSNLNADEQVIVHYMYNSGEKMTTAKWVQRCLILETTAGVPGMVGGMARHLKSLRSLKRDKGWIHHLLE